MMFTNSKISRDEIYRILDDLEWHPVSEFLRLADHIAPEIACRAYLRAVHKDQRQQRIEAQPHIQVKYGRRRIIDEAVRTLKRSGIIEVRGKGKEKMLRLIGTNGSLSDLQKTRDCPCCGVSDPWVGQCGHDVFMVRCRCGLNITRETKLQAIRAWNGKNEHTS